MVQFFIAGLVIGGVYAIATVGLIATYVTAGVLNFAFASLAFFIAQFFYYLNSVHNWPTWSAALISLGLCGPLLGLFLWAVLFRALSGVATMIQIAATIGLSVAVPALAQIFFGNQPNGPVPGLAPEPVHSYDVIGVAIDLNQIIALICVATVIVAGFVILRFSSLGLSIRALVDSPRMFSLVGMNSVPISAGVWIASVTLAGLAGVLIAPVVGLTSDAFSLIVASSFAAVVVARMRLLGRGFLVAVAFGVVGSLAQYWLPPASTWAQDIVPVIPFVVLLIFLVAYARGPRTSEANAGNLRLAEQLASRREVGTASSTSPRSSRSQIKVARVLTHATGGQRPSSVLAALATIGVVFLLPGLLPGFWGGLIGEGGALAVIFLSYTLLTGHGGVVSFCQITFAGIGGVTTAALATQHGWPLIVALLVGGLVAIPVGTFIGFLTLRLGDIYVALVTLSFGLLIDNVVFNLSTFVKGGSGVPIHRPSFVASDVRFSYWVLAIFCLIGLGLTLFKRSRLGMAVSAVRWSEAGAQTVGLSVVRTKLATFAISSFIAGLGGGLLVVYERDSNPTNFATLVGVVWFAVLVANGVRSVVAALVAGITYAILPTVFQDYLPLVWASVPTVLFGLGAIGMLHQPDGFIAELGPQLRGLKRLIRLRGAIGTAGSGMLKGTERGTEDSYEASGVGSRGEW